MDKKLTDEELDEMMSKELGLMVTKAEGDDNWAIILNDHLSLKGYAALWFMLREDLLTQLIENGTEEDKNYFALREMELIKNNPCYKAFSYTNANGESMTIVDNQATDVDVISATVAMMHIAIEKGIPLAALEAFLAKSDEFMKTNKDFENKKPLC